MGQRMARAGRLGGDLGPRRGQRRPRGVGAGAPAPGGDLLQHRPVRDRRDRGGRDKLEIWRRGRACWEQVVDLMGGERVEIPYEDTTLPGFFFRAPDAAPGEQRPLVVVNNGSDGATSAMWSDGGAGAGERGYHWLAFDGPGQQAALFEQGLSFRPDWEAVLTPVVDAMSARDDVDSERLAVIGISQAGFWVPRALASSTGSRPRWPTPAWSTCALRGARRCPRAWSSTWRPARRRSSTRRWRSGRSSPSRPAAVLEFRGEPVRRPERVALRPLRGGRALQAGRRGAADRHAAADHRARGRAVLARPVAGAARPVARRRRSSSTSPRPREPAATASRWPGACATRASTTGWTATWGERGDWRLFPLYGG